MHVPATGFEHNLRWSSIWLASWWPSVWITTGLMKRSNKSRNGCHSPLDAKNWHVMNRLLNKPFTSSREIDSASCHTWWKTTGWCDVFGCRILFFKNRKYFFFLKKNCPSVGDLFGSRSARKMNGTSQWRPPPAAFCGRLLLLLVPLTRHRVKADDVKRWRMARCCFFRLDLFCFSSHSDALPSRNESINYCANR